MTEAQRWSEALAAWAIPHEILSAAPESPWSFPTEVFEDAAKRAIEGLLTPTHLRVASALPSDGRGSLLDVGCGGGAASLPVARQAARLIAVDEGTAMLETVRLLADGVAELQAIEGRWPDVADRVPVADVVVCAHVAYNAPDLGPFVLALTDHSRAEVVMELTAVHPQSWVSPLWKALWGLDRPTTPTADDAAAVVTEALGEPPASERWFPDSGASAGHAGHETNIEWLRRRLCLPADRDDDLRAALAALGEPEPVQMVTMWWPGRGR
jgi:SAM-dependent methyltransferase